MTKAIEFRSITKPTSYTLNTSAFRKLNLGQENSGESLPICQIHQVFHTVVVNKLQSTGHTIQQQLYTTTD